VTDDGKKPPRPDPFAPLPLPETLTGKTGKRESAPTPAPTPAPAPAATPAPVVTPAPAVAPAAAVTPAPVVTPAPFVEPAAASPLPPTAFTSRVSGEHEAPVVPFDASAYEPHVEPPLYDDSPRVDDPPASPEPSPEPAWTEPAAITPEPLAIENELRAAAGVLPIEDKKKKKPPKRKRASTDSGDDDDDDRPRSRLWMVAAALAIVLGGAITAMILVGRSNSERFVLSCESDRVVIQQGRSFPPWGESTIEGAEWKPFKIPPEAPCSRFETENKAELAARFEKMLEDRATKLVGGRGGTSTAITAVGPEDPVAKVDEAEASLKQALLVSRHLASENERITTRDKLERLLGDVGYWRASARLRAAADALTDAAKQFDTVTLQQPLANTDAGEWGALARKLAEELRAGPRALKATDILAPTQASTDSTPKAPLGTALPVEPQAGSAATPAPEVDAGVPASSGGVLL
jgi:hypothetical protein